MKEGKSGETKNGGNPKGQKREYQEERKKGGQGNAGEAQSWKDGATRRPGRGSRQNTADLEKTPSEILKVAGLEKTAS